jgi:hypothetical protein
MYSRIWRQVRKQVLGVLLAGVVLGASASAAWADPHEPQESGHVLRIAAYLVHPIGVLVDTLIFRPAHWLVHKEPLTTLFGHRDW